MKEEYQPPKLQPRSSPPPSAIPDQARKTKSEDDEDEVLYRPLQSSGKGFYILMGVLLAIIALGAYAYYTQFSEGLVVTGMRDVVLWGLYITSFVFFIGISHAGTLISAILRVTKAEWRIPITRMAEAITVFSLMVAIPMILVDMGRPDRLHHIFLFGRIQSPLLWDLISVSTYLTGSLIYLYLPMIPDIAACRDRLTNVSKWKRKLYHWLSLGWRGTEKQKKRLEKGVAVMAILIIPIAISVHTVVSWVFGMTLRVGWHSTIFGPYFVVGAIFSGIAAIIVAMAIFRRVYHLEGYIKLKHFKYLGYLLLVLNIAYIYFTLSEYLTIAYQPLAEDTILLNSIFGGQYSLIFLFMVIGGFIIPAIIIAVPKTRTIGGLVVASILVIIGMWIKRYIIVVGSLAVPLMPGELGIYTPTWVEWSIVAAAFAGFMLLYIVFSKVFPIVSIWEVRESEAKKQEKETAAPEASEAPKPVPSGQITGQHAALEMQTGK
jgi:molybdopterin-containing oxidoreductase family membrane subunit